MLAIIGNVIAFILILTVQLYWTSIHFEINQNSYYQIQSTSEFRVNWLTQIPFHVGVKEFLAAEVEYYVTTHVKKISQKIYL